MDVNILIPVYREVNGVSLLLTSLRNQNISTEIRIRECILLCDDSPEELLTSVRNWTDNNSSFNVSIRANSVRAGKASNLQRHLSEMRRAGHQDSIFVVCDADIELMPNALEALLAPFLSDPDLAVAFGIDVPVDVSWGRWASSFQMKFVNGLASCQPLNTPRAYGRFFAARVSKLEDFEWRSDEIDDVQLGRFLWSKRARCLTVVEARVLALPAGNFRDFYLQTRRWRLASLRTRPESSVANRYGVNSRKRRSTAFLNFRTFAVTSLRYPHWAAAYLFARIAASRPISRNSSSLGALWEPATSTKR